MMPDNFEIEVEYTLQQRNKRFTEFPLEFRELMECVPNPRNQKLSKFLVAVANSMIRTGNAIKNSQQVISDQKVYS